MESVSWIRVWALLCHLWVEPRFITGWFQGELGLRPIALHSCSWLSLFLSFPLTTPRLSGQTGRPGHTHDFGGNWQPTRALCPLNLGARWGGVENLLLNLKRFWDSGSERFWDSVQVLPPFAELASFLQPECYLFEMLVAKHIHTSWAGTSSTSRWNPALGFMPLDPWQVFPNLIICCSAFSTFAQKSNKHNHPSISNKIQT